MREGMLEAPGSEMLRVAASEVAVFFSFVDVTHSRCNPYVLLEEKHTRSLRNRAGIHRVYIYIYIYVYSSE